MRSCIVAVSRSAGHTFRKETQQSIMLVVGEGVEGDAHQGVTVRHRSRVAKDPTQPNLRQVHVIHEELFEELATRGFEVRPGDLGENVTTRGVDLLALPVGARLRLGDAAVVEVTGLRNPCAQIDAFQSGLTKAVLDRDSHGNLVRKTGVMGVVVCGGAVCVGDPVRIALPAPPHRALAPV